MYDDLPDGEVKPVVGEGLNKATRVTLYGVFPKGDDPSEEEERRYEGRVRKNTIKIGESKLLLPTHVCHFVLLDCYCAFHKLNDCNTASVPLGYFLLQNKGHVDCSLHHNFSWWLSRLLLCSRILT